MSLMNTHSVYHRVLIQTLPLTADHGTCPPLHMIVLEVACRDRLL